MTESELPKASLGDNERRRVKQLAALPVALAEGVSAETRQPAIHAAEGEAHRDGEVPQGLPAVIPIELFSDFFFRTFGGSFSAV